VTDPLFLVSGSSEIILRAPLASEFFKGLFYTDWLMASILCLDHSYWLEPNPGELPLIVLPGENKLVLELDIKLC
jgi:hypothetical protein